MTKHSKHRNVVVLAAGIALAATGLLGRSSASAAESATPAAVTPAPVPASIFFAVGSFGYGSSYGSSPWTSWYGGASVVNGLVSGTQSSYGAKVIFDAPIAGPGRTLSLSFPVTLLDASRPQPTVYLQAFDSRWRSVGGSVKTCTAPVAPETRSGCSGSLVLPARTAHVVVGLETVSPLQINDGGGGGSNA